MRALLIVNPNATSTTAATRDVLAHALESRVQLTVAHTQHRDHATELARWARGQAMDLVVVHGGDGTVNEAVNGLLDAPGAAATDAPTPRLAVLPGGSANVFARSLGIDADPVGATNQLIDLLSMDAHRLVGLGRANDRWFTFNAGVGLDAAVCEAIDRARAKGHTATPTRYIRTAVRKFFATRRGLPLLTVQLPDRTAVDGVYYAMVSNSSPWTYLNSLPIVTNPEASFDAGLGVFAMRSVGVFTTLRVAGQLLSGSDPHADVLLRSDDVATVRIRSREPIGVQVDGDYVGTRESVEFASVPAALDVVAAKLG